MREIARRAWTGLHQNVIAVLSCRGGFRQVIASMVYSVSILPPDLRYNRAPGAKQSRFEKVYTTMRCWPIFFAKLNASFITANPIPFPLCSGTTYAPRNLASPDL